MIDSCAIHFDVLYLIEDGTDNSRTSRKIVVVSDFDLWQALSASESIRIFE